MSTILCVSLDDRHFSQLQGIDVQDSRESALRRAEVGIDLSISCERPWRVCVILILSGHVSVPSQVHPLTKSLTGYGRFCLHCTIVAEDLSPRRVKWLPQSNRATYVSPSLLISILVFQGITWVCGYLEQERLSQAKRDIF